MVLKARASKFPRWWEKTVSSEAEIEAAKKTVATLVAQFDEVVASGRLKTFNEENTKRAFITPLFRALGWAVETAGDEVTNEDRVSKGRVDYSFRLNGIPKFFLEAKAASKELEDKDTEQAINYAYYKTTTWAVLSNFRTLIIYNADWKGKEASDFRFIRFEYKEFLDRFPQLWLLSKPAFQQGLLDKEAANLGKKDYRPKVGDLLLQELTKQREALSKNIVKNNAKRDLSEADVDEAVQRIIDRLIFIRTTEDRNIEEPRLKTLAREFAGGKRGKVTAALNEIYLKYDKTYNSKLFTFKQEDETQRHLCETLEIDNETLLSLIENLMKYDFSAIDADVLGNIYEQYLSHILRKTEKRAKVESKEAHRKEQGIYYTPTYIVDYIVRNTLGEAIKNKKPDEVDEIRVLDMACGSGSFLLKAFDVLDGYYKTHDKQYAQSALDTATDAAKVTRKTKILRNNLFGVDLDPKAVEIAQLNLLLKAAETKHRLPDLRENVKQGNSLIDQALGEDARARAFDWKKEFSEIVGTGGFDVIIGNPPYVSGWNMSLEFRDWIKKSGAYATADKHWDIYVLFLERSIKLMKNGARLGMILPYSFLNQAYAQKIRRMILDSCKIHAIVDLSEIDVFADATVRNCIIILEKNNKTENIVTIIKAKTAGGISETIEHKISQKTFNETPENMFRVDLQPRDIKLIEKIKTKSITLDKIVYSTTGVVPHSEKEGKGKEAYISTQKKSQKSVPYIEGKNVNRYQIDYDGRFLEYDPDIVYRPSLPELLKQPKILIKNVVGKNGITATFDDFGYFTNETVNCVTTKNKIAGVERKDIRFSKNELSESEKYDLKFILGLINSKLSNWVYRKMISGELHFYPKDVRSLLVFDIEKNPNKKEVIEIAAATDKMLKLHKKLTPNTDKQTDERTRLEKEIAETDARIDDLVFDLYGLTAEERRIIEEAVK